MQKITDIIIHNVGVDICNATLGVRLHLAGSARQFTNDAKGIKVLITWLGGHSIARVVFEPTGPYRHGFERQLGEVGLAKVGSLQARY